MKLIFWLTLVERSRLNYIKFQVMMSCISRSSLVARSVLKLYSLEFRLKSTSTLLLFNAITHQEEKYSIMHRLLHDGIAGLPSSLREGTLKLRQQFSALLTFKFLSLAILFFVSFPNEILKHVDYSVMKSPVYYARFNQKMRNITISIPNKSREILYLMITEWNRNNALLNRSRSL